ncbi:MAG: dihydroneopterin aldolase [Alphaproteobacteria bacterium]|jgi:dihydroneopterin aldolase
MADKVSLRNIHVFAHHGVFPEEAKLGQKFIISVDFLADLSKICTSDNISDGFCYGDMTQKIVAFCQNNRFNTLEALSHALGKYLLFINKITETVNIKIEKPNAPIKYHVETVIVEITRKRSDYSHASKSILAGTEIYQDA